MWYRVLGIVIGWAVAAGAVQADLETSLGTAKVVKMADRLGKPWSLAFLPGGEQALVTDRGGKLFLVRTDGSGSKTRIKGTPKVRVKGQGGLLDVLVPRDFARSREIFLTYAKKQSDGEGTAVARARLEQGAGKLTNLVAIFEMSPGSSGGRHFGSRIIELRDGSLMVTIGDRADRPSAQDLTRHNGSVIRINRDGSVPSDNPFISRQNARPEIWSFGHRNPQGLAIDLQGRIWGIEHGAKGGDEVNRILKGANYGWPVISYGTHYSGGKIGEGSSKAGMRQPEFYWDPSIAPSGALFYSGKLWPKWRGHLFVGSLKFDAISRLSGSPLKERERIEGSETARVRDVREAPDGSIWFIAEDHGALYRMTPP